MIIPFISVKNALSAIEYYKEVFNAEMNQEMTMLSSIPGFEGKEYEGKVGHSTLIIGGSTIFLNDLLEQYPRAVGENIQLVLDFETEDVLRTTFDLLASEGEIVEPLQEVHWGALFGTVKDKFGVIWQMYYGHK